MKIIIPGLSLLFVLLVVPRGSSPPFVEGFHAGVVPPVAPSSVRTTCRTCAFTREKSPCGTALFMTDKNEKDEHRTLGLLTFDLDDTLYPIAPVEAEANVAFVKAMERFGFTGLKPDDIVTTMKEIREEIGAQDPVKAASLTFREIRELAIRREMEKITARQKLENLAEEEATVVDKLSRFVVLSADKWARAAVSESMVQAVSTAWEMERHHAAERHLYPDVLDALRTIKQEHPDAIIGAVVDGRSNPLFMTFTLREFFDFSCSWEDDQGQRQKFFQELEEAGAETSKLTWIYDEARYKYAVLKRAADAMKDGTEPPSEPLKFPETYDDRVWIHVGDDLAFDVGASAACGAKTIYCKLSENQYKQTARQRYHSVDQPAWSTTPDAELKNRIQMAKAAKAKVTKEINFLTRLPEAINDIVNGEYDDA